MNDLFDAVCPRCKTSKYHKPSMKMLVNVCGHAICESCVNVLFQKGELYYLNKNKLPCVVVPRSYELYVVIV